jgi:hypothetical protein
MQEEVEVELMMLEEVVLEQEERVEEEREDLDL